MEGLAQEDPPQPWTTTTPSVVFSCTKGWLAILVGRLVQDGLLELDAPVARYWPEFAARDKGRITVRQVMSHRAGLAALTRDIDLQTALSWDAITAALADQEPIWEPGTAYGYHALTYGWLVGEVIRRVTRVSVGRTFHDEISEPLGTDAWIGVPTSMAHRVGEALSRGSLSNPPAKLPQQRASDARWIERTVTLGHAFPADLIAPGRGFDDPEVQGAEVPGAGGIASAAALAKIWSASVVETDGVRLLDDGILDDMTAVQSEGEPVWWMPGPYPRWGAGFMLTSQRREFLTTESFGHDGAGGQVGFADRRHEVGFGFVTNLFEVADDERGTEIVRSLRRVLA